MRACRRQIFPLALVLAILMMATLTWVGEPLTTPAAPNGIVSYEFAGSVNRAGEILNSWGEAGRQLAAFSLGLDYLFIVAYVTTIGFACMWAGEVLRIRAWPLVGLGLPLAWSVCLAGVLDGIENISLMILLTNNASPWPQLAAACAAVKFLLILLALLYAVYGCLAWVTTLKRTN